MGEEDVALFSFNMGSQEQSTLNLALESTLPGPEEQESIRDRPALDSVDPSQHIAGSIVEEIDLTSKIAYVKYRQAFHLT